MKKYLVFFLLILASCEKDFIEPPSTQETLIFNTKENLIIDGQEVLFQTLTEDKYSLVIIDTDLNSVVTKESFLSTTGMNTRRIYTKSLPKKKLKLVLLKGSEEINSTFIIVE